MQHGHPGMVTMVRRFNRSAKEDPMALTPPPRRSFLAYVAHNRDGRTIFDVSMPIRSWLRETTSKDNGESRDARFVSLPSARR